jgi:hypothetical protein
VAKTEKLTVERLREVLHYDPLSGVFTWLTNRGSRGRVGKVAGCVKVGRHTLIMIDKVLYKAHRVAFLYMTGRWPDPDCDHRDLEKSNNIWGNIREATRSQNMANTPLRLTNKSGLKGVSWSASHNGWKAQITINYKNNYLGTFKTKEEAPSAYCGAARACHGEFARTE